MLGLTCLFSREQRLQIRAEGYACMYIIAKWCAGKGVRTGRMPDWWSAHVCPKEQNVYFPSLTLSSDTASCAYDLNLKKGEAEELMQH